MKQQTLLNVQHAQMQVQQIQPEELHHVVSVKKISFINFLYLNFFLIPMLIYVTLITHEWMKELGILTKVITIYNTYFHNKLINLIIIFKITHLLYFLSCSM